MPAPTSPPPTDPKKPEGEQGKPASDKPIEAGTPSAKFLQELVGGTPKAAAKPPKADADDLGEKGDAGDEKPVLKPPAPKKKPAAPPSPAPAIDEERLGEAIGKSIARHSAEAPKLEKKEAASPADAKEARKLATFERMEKMNGELYKGITERYKASKAELRKYSADWEKANPGEKFDADAEEHETVIQELEDKFDYDEEDYTLALADILTDKKLEGKRTPRETELEERLTEVERAEKARSKGREITEAAYTAGNDCWKALGDDFAGVVKEDGTIDGEALAEIKKSDPIKHEVAVAAATAAEVGAMKIHMLANGLEKNDPRNPQHAALNQFAYEQEQRMLARVPADRAHEDGRAFASKEQYAAMTPEQQARHWVFSPDDLKALWVHDVARRAKADLQAEDEKFTRRAKARGLIADDEKAEAGTDKARKKEINRIRQVEDDTEDDELSDNGKPQSPSFSLSPKTAGGKPGGGSGAKSGLERFVGPLVT